MKRMLNGISWAQYATVLGVSLLIYYLFIFLLYGRPGKRAAKRESEAFTDFSEEEPEVDAINPDYDQIGEEQFDLANDLMAKISSCIQEAAASNASQELMKNLLASLLHAYPTLNVPIFRKGINDRIINELNELDSVSLTEREVEGLWLV